MAGAQSNSFNEIIRKIKEQSSVDVHYFLLPSYNNGNFMDLNSMSRKELDYWRDMNKWVDPSVSFYFHGNKQANNNQITFQFMEKVTNYFKNRKIVLWDKLVYYPENEITLLRSYEGRERGLDKLVEGLFIECTSAVFEQILFTVNTCLDFLRNPVTYEPDAALKGSMMYYLEDERVCDDILHTLEMISVSNSLSQQVTNSVWAQKLSSRSFFDELSEKVNRLQQADIPPNFKKIMEPFVNYVTTFYQKNIERFNTK